MPRAMERMNIATFIPIDRREALSRQRELPSRSTGAVLFADISGFTSLTTSIIEKYGSNRGAEVISNYLNEVFTLLISDVHNYGGSVVYFSGDAITCWFDGDDGHVTTACALDMHKRIDRFAASNSAIGRDIGIKVIISTGEVSRYVIGDPSIMRMDVIAGRPLVDIARADSVAERGDILVDADTISGLMDVLVVDTWRKDPESGRGFGLVSDIKISPEVTSHEWQERIGTDELRSWLLPEVYERTTEGHSGFLSELRPVTALFMRFEGLSYRETVESGEKMDTFIQWVQQVTRRLGGALLQVTIGDKGSSAYITFGAPVANQNDPERAILTSLILRGASERFDFIDAVHIGISQGQMYVGSYGSAMRRAYSALGTDVNLASRLMTKAGENEVLVAENIQSVTPGFEYKSLEPTALKGFNEPVATFALVGKRALTARDTLDPIAGRDSETALLDARLNELADAPASRISPVLIEAEAGVGKSRLVIDLLEKAAKRDVQYIVGAGDAIERNAPYFVWSAIVQRVLGILSGRQSDEELGIEDVRNVITEHQPEWIPSLSLLNPFFGFDFAPTDEIEQMDNEIQAQNRHRMVVQLIGDAATVKPLLIVLEDAHWFDSVSWNLLYYLLRNMPSVYLIVTTRPLGSPAPSAYDLLKTSGQGEFIKLENLADEAIVQIVSRILKVGSLPDAVRRFVISKAQGNPLFAETLAYALRDTGEIGIAEGEITQAPSYEELQELNFPNTLSSLVLERIDRLDLAEQLTLKVASVLGSRFPFSGLYEIYPNKVSQPYLIEQLNHLSAVDLTQLAAVEPSRHYLFKHVVIHDVSYGLLLFEQRKELHRQVALWYERSFPDDTSLYALLVYHWELAEDHEKTLEYLAKAGAQALAQYANREAIEYLERAVELAENQDKPPSALVVAGWNRMVGQAYYYLGEMENSRQHLHEALRLLGAPEPKSNAALGLGIGRQLIRQFAHRSFGNGQFWRSEAHDDKRVEIARAYDWLSLTYVFNGEQERAIHAIFFALNTSEKVRGRSEDVVSQLSRGYSSVGSAFITVLRMTRIGNWYFERAKRIAEEGSNQAALGWAYQLRSLSLGLIGEFDEAISENTTAMDIYDKMGDLRHWEESAHNQALIAYARGWLQSSMNYSNEHYDSAKRREDVESLLLATGMKMRILIDQSKYEEGVALAEGLDLDTDSDHLSGEVLFVRGCLALALVCKGDVNAGCEILTGTKSLLEKNPKNFVAINGFFSLAEAGVELLGYDIGADKAMVDEITRGSIAALKKTAREMSAVSMPLWYLCQGLYLGRSGKRGKAQSVLLKGYSKARGFNLGLLMPRFVLELNKHGRAEVPEVATSMGQLFDQMGAYRYSGPDPDNS